MKIDEQGRACTVGGVRAPHEDRLAVTKASLLDAAKAAVADRGLNYGKPEDNFLRIAGLWNIYIRDTKGVSAMLNPADIAALMVLMKVARLSNMPAHLDSWTDIAGYAACGAEITNGENSA
ncbi:DUF6378 domain-containing protein [Aurantimonas sp. MSK8Z-1]|uniref:DUF6378 domain-containing protein n=1 Tax=Mangrovibrevibacter kandeliae TaxID=2968473 RepID=UPI002118E28A|nr:DUF6378 domain-containing protein [Aurantimonas sp. MSK8Z-1]MCW4115629.1 DUF6378 domain-containing protein [Aurantimonas sp. MSK8Z-1]